MVAPSTRLSTPVLWSSTRAWSPCWATLSAAPFSPTGTSAATSALAPSTSVAVPVWLEASHTVPE